VCSLLFVDFDGGKLWWVVLVCGWCRHSWVLKLLTGKTWEPISQLQVKLGLQIPNPHPPLSVMLTCMGSVGIKE
jgi:hypothetical protein